MGWNVSQPITLSGALSIYCNASDPLVYTIRNQPANGTLSAVSGNSVTYSPNAGFAGTDSFTFTVNDTTSAGGDAPPPGLTSSTATVTISVSATNVVPTLTLNCPSSPTYNGTPESCLTTLSPYVSGTTTVTYNGSTTAPTGAGNYAVNASFVAAGGSGQNANANTVLVIGTATPKIAVSCPSVEYDDSSHGCTASVTGVGGATLSGTPSIMYNGSTTLPVNGGTYPVVVTFNSVDPNYANASAVSSLTISVPVVTITVNNQTMAYGGVLPALSYTVTPSVPLQTAPACVSTANAASPAGTYAGAISCSGAAKDGCTFIYVAGNMTVQAAPATVTVNNQTMTYGGAVPALTYTTAPAGLTFSTAPVCTTMATSTSSVGTYPVTCSGAVNANYTFTYVAGNMTVQAAPATVTANNQTMIYGGTVPSLTYTATPSGLTFSTAPACSTSATSASSYGTYPISCSGGASSNYALTYVGGTLSVLFAPIVPNGVPGITSISPLRATAASASLILTVNGSGFVNGTTVLWNGTALTTTFVSAAQLTATVPAADLTTVGSANVSVFSPAPGGGTSLVSDTFSIDSSSQTPGLFAVTLASAGVGSAGIVNTSGTAVTWVSGANFSLLNSGEPIYIGGTGYTISTVNSNTGLTLTASAGTSSGVAYGTTLVVTHGQSVNATLTFTGLPSNALVSLVCYNLPAGVNCNYSNGTLIITASANTPPGTYQMLAVCTTGTVQSASNNPTNATMLCSLLGLPIGVLILYRGRKFRLYGLSVLCILTLAGMTGCGSSGTRLSPVNAAQISATLTLTVQ
jgi:hypothetical protein